MIGQRYKWSIELFENLKSKVSRKSTALIAAAALLFVGVSAQASGFLNTPAGGYLVCVDNKTGAVTHPGTSKCKKGQKRLVLGAQGPAGATGANGQDGLVGASGLPGNNGNTLWTGNGAPSNTLGIPGDSYLDLAGKKIHAPKASDGTWPIGISIVGPQGPQGPGGSGPAGPAGANGTNATIAITELFLCDGPDAGSIANEKCKIGMTGPGGGIVFFVDTNDIYEDFNYLEVAPAGWAAGMALITDYIDGVVASDLTTENKTAMIFPDGTGSDPLLEWCDYEVFLNQRQNNLNLHSQNPDLFPFPDAVPVGERFFTGLASYGAEWKLSAAGKGSFNTELALEGCAFGAVKVVDAFVKNGKTDWFLPSLGELMLLYTNLRPLGLGDFISSETTRPVCLANVCGYGDDEFSIEAAYWSSTMKDYNAVYHQHFDTGAQTVSPVISSDDFSPFPGGRVSYVRPIRAF